MKFELDNEERATFNDWNAQHLLKFHGGGEPYGGAIGGRLTFEITGTSIAQFLSVRCNACRHRARADSTLDLTPFGDL